MKIMMNPASVARAAQSYGVKPDKAQAASKPGQPSDKIEISAAAKDFQVAMKALKGVPDTREEKINRLKDLIDSGNYSVSGRDVAEKMIEDIKAQNV
jgi:negative regulator of flagellin synthesis FlgM